MGRQKKYQTGSRDIHIKIPSALGMKLDDYLAITGITITEYLTEVIELDMAIVAGKSDKEKE